MFAAAITFQLIALNNPEIKIPTTLPVCLGVCLFNIANIEDFWFRKY